MVIMDTQPRIQWLTWGWPLVNFSMAFMPGTLSP